MKWQAELDFLMRALERMRLNAVRMAIGESPEILDKGLRGRLDMEGGYHNAALFSGSWIRPGAVYKVRDKFRSCYICMRLTEEPVEEALIIGPYLTSDLCREDILDMAGQLGMSMDAVPQLEEHFASLPVYTDQGALMALVSTFAELLWDDVNGFDIVDMDFDAAVELPVAAVEQEPAMELMKRMEERYAYENEILEIVSKGLINRAEGLLANISRLNFSQRIADPLRNLKNYCVICNTLMRKAAERGGVHPVHIDSMSGSFARKIEASSNTEACYALLGDMLRSYSRLVRTHAIQKYSSIIQKVTTYIEMNLAGDLNLNSIAEKQQVTGAYLSALFKKETGSTITGYITDRRMKAALQLLIGTRLQIQAIAQMCGFNDPNYFGKQFKKLYGTTPANYRKAYVGNTTAEKNEI